MTAYNPQLHGMHTGNNGGVLALGPILFVKTDCGSRSRMSRTQQPRRVNNVDMTLSIEQQYAGIGNDVSTVVVFSVSKDVPEPIGFVHVGSVILQENKHTHRSLSNSKEVCSVFVRGSGAFIKTMHGNYQSLCRELDRFTGPVRHVDSEFLRWLMMRPKCINNRPLTDNQRVIVDYQRNRLFGEGSDPNAVYLIPINGSIEFMTNGRNPNGKIQSMGGPAILTRDSLYKMSTEGIYLFRDVPVPSGRCNKSIKIIRHTVHPDFIKMVLRHFG